MPKTTVSPKRVTDELLLDVRCVADRGKIGVSPTVRFACYHDEFCAWDIPAVAEEGRDAIIEALLRDTDTSVRAIADLFGFTRQRVYQLKDSRDLRKQV